jgi:choline dehydrogenase-like flavoprotein
MPSTDDFDVCVIGTGASGGVMLDQLTAAGMQVVALQRGPYLQPADFNDDELETFWRGNVFASDQVETWRVGDKSPTETGRFNRVAHCVGGTMTHWAAWSWRFRPDEFKVLSTEGPLEGANLADWPISYEELEPYYELAEWEFGVSGDANANPFAARRKRGYPNPPHADRTSSIVFNRATKNLGYHPFPTPMAINSRAYNGRPSCNYGGPCGGYGCPIHAKGTTYAISIPRARATGRLDLRANSMAYEIVAGPDGRARSVRYLNEDGNEQEVFARHIVVAGNAIGSAHLLLMSTSAQFPQGLANSSGLVGRNLMFHHGIGVAFTVDKPAFSYTGLETHAAIDDFHPSEPKRGFIRGGVVVEVNVPARQPLFYGLMGNTGFPGLEQPWGQGFKDYLRNYPRTVGLDMVLEDLPMLDNRIDLDPEVKDNYGLPVPRITHRQHPNDLTMSRWYGERVLEIADAADAIEKWTYYSISEDEPSVKGSAHLHGTCRMGDDPERSVVNRWCRSHDVDNLWVVDGSVFPTSGGYNPTLTILANAYRVADHFVGEARKGNL